MSTAERSDQAKGLAVPPDVDERIRRGRPAMLRDAAARRLCARFWRGDTYYYIDSKGLLSFQSTVTAANGGLKPPHRIRNRYNFIRPIVDGKVSAATQKVPSYDIAPSTTDPRDEGAARMAEQVALFGYDKWNIRSKTVKAVTLAIGCGGDAFAMPYFDPNVGPFTEVKDPLTGGQIVVGQGEVKVLILSGNECYWEPGVEFEESPWWSIERARPVDEVKAIPGFVGGELAADATTSDIPGDKRDRGNLVMVTEFLERPCTKWPDGRRMILAGGKMIVDQRLIDPTAQYAWEDYPLRDTTGQVLDEPVLHRLRYTLDPETDRDFGLTWQLIDAQRTLQDCWNKLLEWKNRTLNPQMKAPIGSLVDRPDDVPGAVRYYRPIGGNIPEWEQPPAVPSALFQMLNQMQADMRTMATDVDLDATDAAAKTLNAIIEQSQNRWQSFLADLASWHSHVMRHCLFLVARYYTEPRLLQIRGRFGPYPISDFQGSQLLDQVNVTVLPGSLEVRTRQQITEQVLAFADRGWVSPQAAMAAINGGTAEKLVESYELDVARANKIIQKIRDGSVMAMGSRPETDPVTGAQMVNPDGTPMQVPNFMPRQVDNLEVWKSVFSDWMKTEDYDSLDPAMQEVANLIFQAIMQLQAQQAQQAAVQQAQTAEALGMGNAAVPRKAPPAPDQRGAQGAQPA